MLVTLALVRFIPAGLVGDTDVVSRGEVRVEDRTMPSLALVREDFERAKVLYRSASLVEGAEGLGALREANAILEATRERIAWLRRELPRTPSTRGPTVSFSYQREIDDVDRLENEVQQLRILCRKLLAQRTR